MDIRTGTGLCGAAVLALAMISGCPESTEPLPEETPTGAAGECSEAGALWDEVEVGSWVTCGRPADGGWSCWGTNTRGEAAIPNPDLVAVSVGDEHSCGLDADGLVVCWGRDLEGQATPPSGAFTQVSVAGNGSCGLRDSGQIECWGDVEEVGEIQPPGVWESIAVGRGLLCALDVEGAATCWGQSAPSTAPSGPFQSLTAGDNFACGVRTDGTGACWSGPAPRGVPHAAPSQLYDAIEAQGDYACGLLQDGSLDCWGRDPLDQTHAPPGRFDTLSVGSSHACALSSAGILTCWGDGSTAASSPPPPDGWTDAIAGLRPWQGVGVLCLEDASGWLCTTDRWKQRLPEGAFGIAPGSEHVCWLEQGGAAQCAGDNGGGQTDAYGSGYVALSTHEDWTCGLGEEGAISCWGESDYDEQTPPAGAFVALDVGGSVACALDEDGALACWGVEGQLEGAPTGPGHTAVSAGAGAACALRDDGRAVCWGPSAVDWDVPTDSLVDIAVQGQACGRHADGGVVCWGDNGGWLADEPSLGSFSTLSGAGAICGTTAAGGAECWNRIPPSVSISHRRILHPAVAGLNAATRSFDCAAVDDTPMAVFGSLNGATRLSRIVTAGDLDADGRDEVVTSEVIDGDRWFVTRGLDAAGLPTVLSETEDLEGFSIHRSPYLAAGDVDGDGDDEWVVSYPSEGRVEVHGLSNGDIWVLNGGTPFGAYLHLGDLDGDGDDELLVGDEAELGTVAVFEWVSDAPPSMPAAAVAAALTQFDRSQIVVGDFNGDGFGDLALGAIAWSTGRVDVHNGSADLSALVVTGSISAPSDVSEFGRAAAAVDINADGFDDLMVGSTGPDSSYNTRDEGRASLFLGTAEGLDEEPAVIFGGTPGQHLGTAFLVGDINGDGLDDVVVGARGEPGLDGSDPDLQASFSVLLGRSGTPSAAFDATFWTSRFVGWRAQDTLGWTELAGDLADLDGDGAEEILVVDPQNRSHLGRGLVEARQWRGSTEPR